YVQSQTDRLGRLLALQEAEASKTRSILESIADGVVFSDADGQIVLTNVATEEILGTPAAQMQGRDVRDLVLLAEPEDRPVWLAVLDTLMASRNRGAVETAAERLTLRIANRVANVHLSPVVTGTNQVGEVLFLGVVMVFRDVTRETEADRLKNEFVATVSHELRTPLTSIRGYVDLILDGDVGDVSDDVSEYLQVVKSNSNRLTALINNLLDISRIEEGRTRFDLATVDVAALAQDAAERFRAEAEEKNLMLRVSVPVEPLIVQADTTKLVQVLDHLISNAVKYTPPAGEVTVTVQAHGNRVQLDVTDTGIGIAPQDQDKLFTRFFRAEHPDVEFAGGTGLGLSIAKAVVEAHGGKIWAASPGSGQGSTFSFTIPLTAEAQSQALADGDIGPAAAAPPPDRRRLLVVDDDRDIIRLLYNRLQRDGYLVDTATSGPEALRRVAESAPDLVLLDILMPEMDGGTVLERLKADPSTANIPVVVLSIVDDQRRFLMLGATEYLTKPFDEGQLEKVISEVLGQAGRVLIADDDPDIVMLLQRVLQRRGFETLVAGDGEAALAQAHGEPPPDLILLDLRMPQLDGYQVLERLRENPATHAIPVMIITGAAPDLAEKRQRSLALGASQLVLKPIDIETLVSEIRRLV
ncbi:MAG: response regulator, partial [Chloroflexi bacterium]|nr:response regulator [Chloroflexota bacterium]